MACGHASASTQIRTDDPLRATETEQSASAATANERRKYPSTLRVQPWLDPVPDLSAREHEQDPVQGSSVPAHVADNVVDDGVRRQRNHERCLYWSSDLWAGRGSPEPLVPEPLS